MSKLPHSAIAKERQQEQQEHRSVGNDQCPNDEVVAFEVLEKLEKKQEVPFGPSRIVFSLRIGGSIQVGPQPILPCLGPALIESRFMSIGSRRINLVAMPAIEHQRQHDGENEQAGDKIAENLTRPKI